MGEIALILAIVCFFVNAGITRVVYRAYPIRGIKIASITYLVLLGLSLLAGFIDLAAAALMVVLLLTGGLLASLLLLMVYIIAWSRG